MIGLERGAWEAGNGARHGADRAVAGLVLCGIALRLTGLDIHSLWLDEGFSIHVASAEDLWGSIARESNPPLMFLLYRCWLGLVGEHAGTLRLLGASLSGLSLLLVARATGSLIDRRAQRAAVAMHAMSPFVVWYAQEARPYFLVELGSALCLAGVAAWGRMRRGKACCLALAGSVIACGAHYFGALVVVWTGLWSLHLAGRGPGRLRFLAWLLVGFLLWLPWMLVYVPQQLREPWAGPSQPSLADVLLLPIRLVAVRSWQLPSWVPLPLCAMLAVAGAGAIWSAVRGSQPARTCVTGLLLTVAIALAPCVVGESRFMVRYLMGCTPLVSTVFGLGWAAVVGPRMAVWMWTGLIAAFGVIHVHLRLGNLKDDYRGAVESVVRAWRPGEGIAAITGMPDEFGLPPVRVYLRELGGDRVAVEGLKEVREASDVRPPMHIVVRMMDYTARARERIEAMGLPVLKTRLDSVLEHWCVGR